MSLWYILDGYNIVKQVPALNLKELQGGRESLVRLIEIYKPQGSRNNSVTIVFDGQEGISHPGKPSSVKVIFSNAESADDKIKSLVAACKRKKETIVVTDDRELQFSVRALGALVLSVSGFLEKVKKQEIKSGDRKVKDSNEGERKAISKALEFQINAELEKIWLKK